MTYIFPGMDPYLEHPNFWPEVHHWLISLIAETLMPQIRPKYEVGIEKRIYEVNDTNDTNGERSVLIGIPDATVKQPKSNLDLQPTNIAVAAPTTQPRKVMVPVPTRIKHVYLEVRDMETGWVVTAIEILSPVNKRSGEGRMSYLQKRQGILVSLTNLVEIDLLRGGKPMPTLDNDIESDYRVLVSRGTLRPEAELYSFNLEDRLPSFPLPLRSEDKEPIIDLQVLLNQVYDRAGYDYRIDYSREVMPALAEKDKIWVKELLGMKNQR